MNEPVALAGVLALPHDDAYSRVVGFARRFGEAHATLAMHAAFPLGLSPELVHLLRINLAPEAPFIAEADLLLSSLCREVGGGLYEMDAPVRELLLDELLSDAQLGLHQLRRIAHFVAAYTERAVEGTRDPELKNFFRVQRWAALAYLQPERAARQLLGELEDARQAHDRPRLIRLARITDTLSAPLAGQRGLINLVARLKYPPTGAVAADVGDQGEASSRQYVSAKVVLLGDTGVGKSGLGHVLAADPYRPTDSTHARAVRMLDRQEIRLPGGGEQAREIQLWDLAGQPGYRLLHQLYLNEVAVALIVFDARSETDPFAGVRYWTQALAQARRLEGVAAIPARTYLVAARTDRGGSSIDAERVRAMVDELGLDGFFETSAKEGWGIAELADAIRNGIAWDALPVLSSSELLESVWQFLLAEQQRDRLLATEDDLFSGFRSARSGQADDGLRAGFEICIGRMESRGLIRRLHFGSLVLLQPEYLDGYASAMIITAREEPDGLGFIAEEAALSGRLRLPESERITDRAQEKLLLIATIEELVRHEIALREYTDRGVELVFPSQFTRQRPDAPDIAGKEVIFTFDGPPSSIYATLAVRLSRSSLFRRQAMWQNAASFAAAAGGVCGIYVRELKEGRGEIVLFYDEEASQAVRSQFETYVADHLQLRAIPGTLSRRVIRACSNCGYVLPDELVQRRLELGATTARCPVCEQTVISLTDEPAASADQAMTEMNQSADERRDLSAAELRLKGKVETRDYDVFLCHNAADKPAVRLIARRLHEHGILPWLDEAELPPGRDWQEELERQISNIRTAAVFVGPSGIGPWQNRELRAFLNEFAERGCPVIPVLLPEAVQPELPVFLRSMTWVDLRAQDKAGIERLIWGITGRKPIVSA